MRIKDLVVGDVFWAPEDEGWIFTVREPITPRLLEDKMRVPVTPSGAYPHKVSGDEYVVYSGDLKIERVRGRRRSKVRRIED